jgi:hypothetical protein
MHKDWKKIAVGMDLDIPAEELEKMQGILDPLESAFAPLTRRLSHDIEPAFRFECPPEEEL